LIDTLEGERKVCMNEVRIEDIKSIRELFELWKAKQDEEIEEIAKVIDNFKADIRTEKEIFETEYHKVHWKRNKCTISSQFSEFFNASDWKKIIKNAFNMDGCIGKFEPENEGYSYAFLLKEANDSKKRSRENYPEISYENEKVNSFIKEWVDEGNYEKILNRLFDATKIYLKKAELSRQEFADKFAYVNVNKRGGVEYTRGYNKRAVWNYAEQYKIYILQQIYLLAGNKKEIIIFVAGDKKYYKELMKRLTDGKEVLNYKEKAFTFINITHPSNRGPDDEVVKKLAHEMQLSRGKE